jgi:ABC-type transport system involved in multi-copper enzyme maturation permease subunit
MNAMKTFLGVVRYEYRMSTRRLGLWIAFGVVTIPYLSMIQFGGTESQPVISNQELWPLLAQMIFQFNLFMPVVAGIAIADRLVRDSRLGVDEILRSTRLNRWSYLLGKYLGSLLSVLTPVFLFTLFFTLMMLISGMPTLVIWIAFLEFLSMIVPAFAFITIFSLACPLVMPVRVYQVLFTGYWFWGNFLNSKFFPTISDTYLSASGKYACRGFFNGCNWSGSPLEGSTSLDAWLNIAVLGICILAALIITERFLAWQSGNLSAHPTAISAESHS